MRGQKTILFIVRLPVSGIIFMLEVDLIIKSHGIFYEINRTPLDIKLDHADLPKSITKEELLKDEWIKKIIDEM